ncbi:DUF4158 domain-containing protein [Nonomuraea sp. NPDC050680]|uniref:DUF4158 domain-containing protein n=1 Tax=Nonomuraea sp. NPDC050680 TaxID=3154630 RepID=UPI0033C33E33
MKDFASAEAELAGKVRAHAWNTGDGPTACFQYAVRWLRQNDVLLPGISTLTRLVARERERATRELHDTLVALRRITRVVTLPEEILDDRDDLGHFAHVRVQASDVRGAQVVGSLASSISMARTPRACFSGP